MNTDRELMQQALEALIEARMAIIDWSGYASEYFRNKYNADGDAAANDELITALRERLAQPEQEPVACQYAKDVAMPDYRCAGKCQYAQSQRKPLTDEQIKTALNLKSCEGYRAIVRAIEAAHGIGEKPDAA